MIANVSIIAFSLILFVYWFRYSCLLLLRNRAGQAAAPVEQFHYAEVQQALDAGMELDPLHRSLDRDYRLLTYLLEHAAGLELEKKLEYRLLVLDYKVMQSWYRVTKSSAPRLARRALAEMADVLEVFGGRISHQAGVEGQP